MRIISGKYGRRRFDVPRTFRARPTTDMAKENLFNILANRVDWETTDALDLFAGTGSLGFEMLSRGARSVTAMEREEAHVAFIRQVAEVLADPRYRVLRLDVLKWLRHLVAAPSEERPQYRVIVADPPYDMPELPELPDLVLRAGLLAPDGLLVQEHSGQVRFDDRPGFVEERHYGAVHFSFFRPDTL